jgi:hypothetical protein
LQIVSVVVSHVVALPLVVPSLVAVLQQVVHLPVVAPLLVTLSLVAVVFPELSLRAVLVSVVLSLAVGQLPVTPWRMLVLVLAVVWSVAAMLSAELLLNVLVQLVSLLAVLMGGQKPISVALLGVREAVSLVMPQVLEKSGAPVLVPESKMQVNASVMP